MSAMRCTRLSPHMVEAAVAHRAAGAGDPDVLAVKRAKGTHYATHVLVQASVLCDIVMIDVASTLALSGDQL